MDVDELAGKSLAIEPETAASGQVEPELADIKLEHVPETQIEADSTAAEVKIEETNLEVVTKAEAEVSAENNEYYRLIMQDMEDWSATVPRVVVSPVTGGHFSSVPSNSVLSVYTTLLDTATTQLSLENSTRVYGTDKETERVGMVTDTVPFLCSTLQRRWRPLAAPSSTLIDVNLPDPLREWESIVQHAPRPIMETLLDPSNLALKSVLIKWRSVAPFTKIRRFGKRIINSIEPIAPTITEEENAVEEPTHIKPLPRNAKKRLRDSHNSDRIDPEMEDDRTAKRRREGKELCIRFPVSLALQITRSTLNPSSSGNHYAKGSNTYAHSNGPSSSHPKQRKNAITLVSAHNASIDSSAAELLASFRSS